MDDATIALLTGPVSALGLAVLGYAALWHLLTKIVIPNLSALASRSLDQIDKFMENLEKLQKQSDLDRELFKTGLEQINRRLDRLEDKLTSK